MISTGPMCSSKWYVRALLVIIFALMVLVAVELGSAQSKKNCSLCPCNVVVDKCVSECFTDKYCKMQCADECVHKNGHTIPSCPKRKKGKQ